jgi:hypothetical protein
MISNARNIYLFDKMGDAVSRFTEFLPFAESLNLSASRLQRERDKPDDTRSLVMGPLLRRRQSEQTKFVVPQIFVDYGSRRTSYASDYMRRCSAESASSRRTSLASGDSDRRGSGSSLSSRRTSLASDVDRRGSAGSSISSRRTSLLSSDCASRRGSGSSKSASSRKSSDASRFGDTDELLAGKYHYNKLFPNCFHGNCISNPLLHVNQYHRIKQKVTPK